MTTGKCTLRYLEVTISPDTNDIPYRRNIYGTAQFYEDLFEAIATQVKRPLNRHFNSSHHFCNRCLISCGFASCQWLRHQNSDHSKSVSWKRRAKRPWSPQILEELTAIRKSFVGSLADTSNRANCASTLELNHFLRKTRTPAFRSRTRLRCTRPYFMKKKFQLWNKHTSSRQM